MAMGIVSDKDFDSERERLSPTSRDKSESVPKPAIIINPAKGRGEGNIEVPNTLRNLIGETSLTSGRQEALELAKNFGVSQSSVSAYTKGATSTSTIDERPNAPVIENIRARIGKRARAKMMMALNHITDEKMRDAKVRDLAGIAKDMSAVVKAMEEADNPMGKGNSGPTFVFYSPQLKKEESFDVIHVNE